MWHIFERKEKEKERKRVRTTYKTNIYNQSINTIRKYYDADDTDDDD